MIDNTTSDEVLTMLPFTSFPQMWVCAYAFARIRCEDLPGNGKAFFERYPKLLIQNIDSSRITVDPDPLASLNPLRPFQNVYHDRYTIISTGYGRMT